MWHFALCWELHPSTTCRPGWVAPTPQVYLKDVYTYVIFSVRCDSRIRHRTKIRIDPIFCALLDAAVASDTENHGSCKQTLKLKIELRKL
jgi:hypothetical protein